jgi:RNA-splicing ligase RtcB
MIDLGGKYNNARVFTNNIDNESISEIINLCNQEFTEGSKIRIMPDVHKGAGCVIGTTMTVSKKVVPNLVGVDIGCGMLTVKLKNIDIDLPHIDKYINENIPSGFKINKEPQADYSKEISKLRCAKQIKKSPREFNKALLSLGGGNHFIEIDIDNEGCKYLIIHSGSRNLGYQVANYYQNLACDYHYGIKDDYEEKKKELIQEYKKQGKEKEISKTLERLEKEKRKKSKIPKDLCYLEGALMNDYLHDINIIQKYAKLNRELIAKKIVENSIKVDYSTLESFQTIHNYIDIEKMILRKGAISAKKGELVLIPINMRDGCILAKGKGNPEWNYSAPHGAGRLFSRSKAKEIIGLEEFEGSMKEVYSTSVRQATVDESPMAYKPIEDIISNIHDTVEILKILKPIYNFKS